MARQPESRENKVNSSSCEDFVRSSFEKEKKKGTTLKRNTIVELRLAKFALEC